jgi:cyclohexa-1,5-dienecarbonyl-CoA hydratase
MVTVAVLDDGALWRVTFGASKGNVIDRATMTALRAVLADARATPGLKGICLEGAGGCFSYGASIQEHLPSQVREMLADFRHLILDVIDTHIVTVAAVSGACLGGGLELATACHRIVAAADATFGQPEIALGVFAPVASILLPERIGRARAEDLCLTGRTIAAGEAIAMGVADEIASGDPADSALAWLRAHVAPRSASSLRQAVAAIRASLAARLRTELPRLEALYLRDLMTTRDAVEGLDAFLQKRPPRWSDS